MLFNSVIKVYVDFTDQISGDIAVVVTASNFLLIVEFSLQDTASMEAVQARRNIRYCIFVGHAITENFHISNECYNVF